MKSTRASAALSVLTYSALASAAAVQNCIGDNNAICYAVGVPEASASSNSGNIYFQISAPTSQSWVALGTGSRMSGSYMFVMYQDGTGNVTISPRLGTNHQMPVEDTSSSAAQLTLLAGSGVDGNTMRANVRCANCESWDGGSMSLTGTSDWIAAWLGGDSLATTDKNADISRHSDTGSWQFDLSRATISSDANPFVASSNDGDSNSGSDSGSGSGSGSDSGSGSGSGSDSGSGSGSGNNGGSDGINSGNSGVINNVGSSPKDTKKVQQAHGIIMAIVFVILYPLGSILMPLLGNWMAHAAFQFFNFVFMWIGFGLGYVLAQRTSINFTEHHTVLGTVVVCLMVLQPVFGWLHHMHYVKHQARGPVSYAHIAYGRILMILGVINGGLGLKLTGSSDSLVVAYSVVSAIVAVLYIALKSFASFRKRRNVRGAGRHGKGDYGNGVEMK